MTTRATTRLETAAVRAVLAFVRLLPEPLVPLCGAAIGMLAWAVDGRHRRVALANVAAALPDLTPRQQRAIVRLSFRHFGRLLFELLKFGTLPIARVMARSEFEGAEHVEAAYAAGRGVLFVTGHFGFWEINALAHGERFQPIGLLARALDNPELNRLLEEIRQRTGNFVIYRQGTIRRVMRALQQGQGVAVLIDQHVQDRDAVRVDFLARPANATPAVAALALRTGAAVIPVFSRPAGGGRYRMIYEPPVPAPPADDPDAIREYTQRCTQVLETWVRRYPGMWLWMHRRWRT
ncbi:MAG: lysophospholipid acyltransferase family protein [Acidobacteriota bacterium]|nr:lysophospholipid acyltransferase family protein [Acidobacteriota bacterium]